MDTQTYAVLIASCAMLFDIVSGVAKACHSHNIRSEVLREGAWHKVGFVGLIVLGYMLQYAATIVSLPWDIPSVIVVCAYIITTEAVSVFENLSALNPDLAASPMGRFLAVNDEQRE